MEYERVTGNFPSACFPRSCARNFFICVCVLNARFLTSLHLFQSFSPHVPALLSLSVSLPMCTLHLCLCECVFVKADVGNYLTECVSLGWRSGTVSSPPVVLAILDARCHSGPLQVPRRDHCRPLLFCFSPCMPLTQQWSTDKGYFCP